MIRSEPPAVLYSGTVVHARLRPKRHKLAYRVFSLLLDADRLPEISRLSRLVSHNRFNLVSIHDRDFADRSGTPPAVQARRALQANGLEHFGARILILTYPRVLGAVFNPLTVYYCEDAAGRLGAVIHEVSNTYGERKSYVLPVALNGGTDASGAGYGARAVIAQTCAKELSVSPFTRGSGAYGFRLTPPGDRLAVGVHYRDEQGPVLKTHFAGDAQVLTTGHLLRQFYETPFQTQRVLGAIHLEALKLWLKGVPLVPRHRSPGFSLGAGAPSDGP